MEMTAKLEYCNNVFCDVSKKVCIVHKLPDCPVSCDHIEERETISKLMKNNIPAICQLLAF